MPNQTTHCDLNDKLIIIAIKFYSNSTKIKVMLRNAHNGLHEANQCFSTIN